MPRTVAEFGRGLSACLLGLVAAVLLLNLSAPTTAANELRRSAVFIRPLLMGNAYVAVGDEASTLFYNPAGFARLGADSVDLLTPQIILDDRLKRVLIDQEDIQAQYSDRNLTQLQDLIGTSLFARVNVRAPVITWPDKGMAFGAVGDVLANVEVIQQGVLLGQPLPALHVEYFSDLVGFVSFAGQLTENLSVGITPKLIRREGLDKTIDAFTLLGPALDGTVNLENDPDYQQLVDRTAYSVPGVDLGMIYWFPFGGDWHPRIGYSILNIGNHNDKDGWLGMEFGPRRGPDNTPVAGKLPLLHTLGFAVSPTYDFIRYTFALDFVDVTQQALTGKGWPLRSRVGFEVGIGPHEDGTALFSLLLGWNATHFSVGALTRVWIFEAGMGRYEVERGDAPGDNPDKRYVLLFGFRY